METTKNSFRQKLRQKITKRNVLIASAVTFILIMLMAFWPKSVKFSYAGSNCVDQLTVLPRLLKSGSNTKYVAVSDETINVSGYPIIGKKVCISALAAPKEGKQTVEHSLLGTILFNKSYNLSVAQNPMPDLQVLKKPIPATKSLQLALPETDTTFSYKLEGNKNSTICKSQESKLICEVKELKLAQGKKYQLKLQRYFKDERIETIADQEVEMLRSVSIKKSSIKNDQTVFEKPKSITFVTDKKLKSASAELKQSDKQKTLIKTKTIVEKNGFSISWEEDLKREVGFELSAQVEAEDGSSLESDYKFKFKTSGGPKVVGINIGKIGVVPGSTVVVQLDQPIKGSIDITKFAQISGVTSSVSKSGSQIIFSGVSGAKCTDFSVLIKPGLISNHDVKSSQTWSYGSRLRCYDIATIGYSRQGRPINAYYFGSGSISILFTGLIHGDENSSGATMNSWIAELDAKARNIPKGRKIVVVPTVNPDGVASGSRYNSKRVDLNRNFATSNWKKDIQTSDGTIKGGGGSSASSEPETRALANLVGSLAPRLVVTFHSSGSLVNTNDVGISVGAGSNYASQVGYSLVRSSGTSSAFDYNVTGSFEDWLGERGTAAFLVELSSDYGNYFYSHQTALWDSIKR